MNKADEKETKPNFAFIAMPMDKDDHHLVDVLETIKYAAQLCGIRAERVDDTESNERITDRILKSINSASYVIVDLTKERPNVFFEAGYAQGRGKTAIYIARQGTPLHFDIRDYPVILFRSMKELREGIQKRLDALSKVKPDHNLATFKLASGVTKNVSPISIGNAEILEVFNISKVGQVGGCRVTDGKVERGANVRLIRDNVVIHEGKLSTLKRFKDEVREVVAGQECGMGFENYHDMKQGDVIECFC